MFFNQEMYKKHNCTLVQNLKGLHKLIVKQISCLSESYLLGLNVK